MASMKKTYRNVLRGSKASRTPSPMKINSDSMIATEKKPVKPSHGACTLALPCDSNSPSDGEPGGRPKPRKSSAVSVITEDDTMKGRKVMVATIAFGNRWRNMITALETPSSTKKPGTSTEERIRSRYSEGIALQTSMKRWKPRSIQPPK